MEFHISRSVRDLLKVDDLLFSYTGNVVFANVAASRKLAQQLNEARGTESDPKRAMHAGALFAMGLIDELQHALIDLYRKEVDPAVLKAALEWFALQVTPAQLEALLLTFTEHFPSVAVYRKELTAAEYLTQTTHGLPNREAALEELLLLWLANTNPALTPFLDLFQHNVLEAEVPAYLSVVQAFPAYFETRPTLSPEIGSLLDALRAPITASPDSLTGQLDYIRTHWAEQLGPQLRRTLLAIDTLREEDLAIWMRFNPPGPDRHRHGAFGTAKEGFAGDEYVGFGEAADEWTTDAEGRRVQRRRYASGYQAPLNEYEAFSTDQAWMPNVVLLAKSTYVWLEQLSQKYKRHIFRLDQVPDEELRTMAGRGITGLWLIGLWERSVASRTIKHLRGNTDAVASAYSLKDYQIAEDLGGNSAYENLRDRAARFGLRLASDMVPNHMGIDSPWVIENPDWFMYRWESPFPVYQFNGPDLSNDARVEIKIEDHYYDQTDAAVIFRLRHHGDGATRYMYHGNDGTTFAWNDTAQLDYSKAAVREHVMQVILHVARLFPIIRFDAAMVLAKRHVQRLWFPLPGAGGSIPSRAENAISDDEFNALMPVEFWREVVDRVAIEVPGTLLLAEAFWLLEGYFVRTLGMHRVYNSAFMVMLRDEENAKYRSYLKKTLEFDPDILKRYVNFMSNPDEKTAIAQFGSGDKFFGVATLLATLPGLPMFAHGQIEGFTEQYGMEFKQAKMQEWPNEHLITRFEHEIAPLLRNRRIFAESANFVMYDCWKNDGTVDENVFAYSNNYGGERSFVAYNNTYASTRGTLHHSAAYMDKGSGEMRQRSLADGLALPYDGDLFVAYRDATSNLEHLRRATDIHHDGMTLDLRGFQYVVLLQWRELRASAEKPWDQLHDLLKGSGVYSLEEALSRLRLRPVHEALRQAFHEERLRQFAMQPSHAAEALLPAAGFFFTRVQAYLLEEGTPLELAIAPEKLPVVEALPDSFIAPASVASELPGPLDREPRSKHLLDLNAMPANVPIRVEDLPIVQSASPLIQPEDESTFAEAEDEDSPQGASISIKRLTVEEQYAANVRAKLAEIAADRGAAASRELFLPGSSHLPANQTQAPALAATLISALPANIHADPKAHVVLFDQLLLRAGLAESFASLGMEGEGAWRAAALTRVLIAHNIGSINTEAFWNDPDVRWLAGVNQSEGTAYFNRELFSQLLPWLELDPETHALTEDPTRVEADLLVRAETSGYQVQRFLHPAGFVEASHGFIGVNELAEEPALNS